MGRTKIEMELSEEEQREFFKRCAQVKGGTKGPGIRAIAAEFNVTLSHDSANNVRNGPLADYLKRLEKNGERARELVELAKHNVPTSRANEIKLGMAISDKLDADLDEMSPADLNRVSLINARLSSSERQAADLERKLANSETARDTATRRTAVVEKQLELVQFDAAAAALEHAMALREIVQDKTIDAATKLERARQRMFGDAPAGLRPIGETHGQAAPPLRQPEKGGKTE